MKIIKYSIVNTPSSHIVTFMVNLTINSINVIYYYECENKEHHITILGKLLIITKKERS